MFFRQLSKVISFRSLRTSVIRMEMDCTPPQELTQKKISEGQAEITLSAQKVFYNPVQEFNRDLSIAVLTVFTQDYHNEKIEYLEKKVQNKKKDNKSTESLEESTTGEFAAPKEIDIHLLEALAATGLRSIRYAKEVPKLTKVIANDNSMQAVETMKVNFKLNNVDHLVETSFDDACMLMYKHKQPQKRFAVIDLDPYGCPSIFLDAAIQSIQDGGLLLVTATDMAVLAGNSPETCYSKYGAVSLKAKCCHEMALRILLQCIEQHANRYSRYIVPLLSISADFYIRVFVKVYSGALQCKDTTSKLSMVYQCVGCGNITLQPLGAFKPNPTEKNPNQKKGYLPTAPTVGTNCIHCNQKHHLGGPIWSAPIHDETFVTKLLTWLQGSVRQLGTYQRIVGVLSMVREELQDVPLYYTLDKMNGRLHLETMPMLVMRSAILNAGYKVSYSHANKMSIKTTAPAQLLWDVLRTWEKTHPVKPARLEADPISRHILSQEIKYEIDLNVRSDANPISRRDGFLRFQDNPTPFWGPGSRAVVNVGEEKMSKSIRNQNKSRKNKNIKRQHSEGEDGIRKKINLDSEMKDV